MTRMDYADFLPLFPLETEAAIRAQMNAWANEGLALDDPNRVDTREGSMFQILTEPQVRIAARAFDRMSESVAMSNPLLAGGYYLDLIGLGRGVERLAATFATGVVLFTAAEGTVIAAGTPVSATAVVPGDPAISFETDSAVVVATGGTQVTATVTAVEAGVSGNLPTGAISIVDLPDVTVTNEAPTTDGTDVEDDDHLAERIIATYAFGGANAETIRGWALAYPGVGRAIVRANFFGPGTTLLIVESATGGPVGSSVLTGLQNRLDPPNLSTTLSGSVTLPSATITVASTLGARVPAADPDFIEIGGQVVSYTGMTGTTFTGCSGGTGTIADGTPVHQSGSGAGIAPAGMYLLVKTSSLLPIDVVAEVRLLAGYGIAGTGTTDVTPFIFRALSAYIDAVQPGSLINLSQVFARIAESQGIDDVDFASLTIAGAHANMPVDDTPPQKPYLRNLTLSSF